MRNLKRASYFCCVLFLGVAHSFAQELSDDIKESKLAQLSDPMEDLIQPIEVEGRLQLLKNWQVNLKREMNSGREGIEEELESHRLMQKDPELQVYFGRLWKARGFDPSRGSSCYRGWEKTYDRDGLTGYLMNANDRLIFRFSDELAGIVVELKQLENCFVFRAYDDDRFLDLHQTDDRIRLIMAGEGEPTVVVAENYVELVRKNPTEAEALFSTWKAIGIPRPALLSDPKFVFAVIRKLKATENGEEEVIKWLTDLTGDSIKGRNAAEEKLLENYFFWSDLIEKHKGIVHEERAQKRLVKIMAVSPGDFLKDQVDLKDWNDPGNLIELWRHAPADYHPLIVKRLESATDKSFGNEIEKWEEEFKRK